MKFRIGSIPVNPDFNPAPPWQPLDEPGPKTFLWVALPFGLFTTIAFIILWFGLTELTIIDFLYWYFYYHTFLYHISLFIGLIVVHELIHAIFHPGYGFSPKSIFGLWPSKGAFYAFWDDEWSRNRAIACISMPFIVLSVLPLLICLLPVNITPWMSYNIMSTICFISIINSFFACADIMGTRLFFLQVPANGILRNKGFHTYWRIKEKSI